MSAVGADAGFSIFYTKTKGELERDIIALHFEHTSIFQPSILLGNRKENRPIEEMFIKVFALINPLLIGKLNKYKGIDGKDVAKAMNKAAKNQSEKVKFYQFKEMVALL